MLRVTVVAFAALCLIGTSSLALAEDAMKSEEVMGARKAGPAGEVGNTGSPGVMSARGGEPKAAKGHMKGKTKKHKDAAKAPAAPAPAP